MNRQCTILGCANCISTKTGRLCREHLTAARRKGQQITTLKLILRPIKESSKEGQL